MDLTLLDFLKIVLQVQMSAVLSSAQNGSKITPLTAIRHLIYILSWYTDSTLVTNFSNLYEDAKWSFSAVFSAQKLYLVHRMNSNFLCSVQNISVTIPYLLFSGLFKINQKKKKKRLDDPLCPLRFLFAQTLYLSLNADWNLLKSGPKFTDKDVHVCRSLFCSNHSKRKV
jgi:hypothetical protein